MRWLVETERWKSDGAGIFEIPAPKTKPIKANVDPSLLAANRD
jgi:hypothetical protein